MATSDNVVRVGLTPKLKDVDTLVDMLTYSFGPARLLEPVVDGSSKLFNPPVNEFRLLDTRIGKGEQIAFEAGDGPGIILVYGGSGKFVVDGKEIYVTPGKVYFLPAGTAWKGMCGDCEALQICKAFYSLN
jgi:mannose-6-phosphate isomerase